MRGVRGRNLIAVDYEQVEQVLICRFAKSGEYRYRGVPENVFQSLLKVPFADSYFTKVIKGKFPVDKPEKVKDAKDRDVQNTAGRNSDSGTSGANSSGVEKGPNEPRDSAGMLQTGRRDVGSKGAITMEFYRQADGLEFIEDGHRYLLNGNRVISLTQILDAAGLVDYSMVQPDVLAAKAKFGSKVHEYCLWNDQGELDMDDLKPYVTYHSRVLGWQQFIEDFHFKPDLNWCEIPVAVKLNGMTYALTIDRFGTFGTNEEIAAGKGSLGVVEIKTCAEREPSHRIQTAGQAILFRGDGSVPVRRMAVYLLDRPNQANRFYFCEPHEERIDEKIFLSALTLTQWRINNKLIRMDL